MKICHIVDELSIGGLEKIAIQITTSLRSHMHEIWCLKNRGILADIPEKAGITVREFRFDGRIKLSSMISLVKRLRRGKFDIVHSHGPYPFMWAGPAGFLTGVHGCIHHAHSLYCELPSRDKFRVKCLSGFVTKIIAVSQAVKKSLVEDVWIDPSRIEVVYNSAPDLTKELHCSREEMRKTLGISVADFVIGSVGRLERNKGHHLLLEAIAKCVSKNLKCKCVIAGDGSSREDLQLQAKNLGISGSVIFTGFRRDIPDIMAVMDVISQPSTLREGLPLTLAEAVSLSLPIIAADVGGNKEVVLNGVNGFVVEPNNSSALAEKILYIAEKPQELSKMRQASRDMWSKSFSIEKMMDRINSIYMNCQRH